MPEWLATLSESFTLALTLIVMLVGLFGLVVPIFPGGWVIWLAAGFYGLTNGFGTWGIVLFVFITLAAIAGSLVDNVLMGKEARRAGASWWSLLLAGAGGILGTIIAPPFGGLVGAPLFLLLAEWWQHRNWRKALKTTRGLAVGWGWSFLARFGIGVLMIMLWGVWVGINSAA
jgi:uncharacterized protein YqgC (DUF456 family)